MGNEQRTGESTCVYPVRLEKYDLYRALDIFKKAGFAKSGNCANDYIYFDLKREFYGSCSSSSPRIKEATSVTQIQFLQTLELLDKNKKTPVHLLQLITLKQKI